ncbi:MAG: type II/IV secretion system protein [Candidatus Niyogibacteria bacterium]|nr:type II/IV secretion system protein [Candidatus Niyogibacteria bacterium]
MDSDPESPFVPDHPFVAKQVVAFDEFHTRTEELPFWTKDGFAEISTVGRFAWTFTATLSDACPALFEQVIEYVVVLKRDTTSLPESTFVPDHPPDAEHVFAFEDVHERTDELPWVMLVGFALMSTVGNGEDSTFTLTESFAEPPGPVQYALYVCELRRFPDDWLPDVPAHPEGVTEHEVAFVEVHEMVVDVLYPIVIGPLLPFACISTVGGALSACAATGIIKMPTTVTVVSKKVSKNSTFFIFIAISLLSALLYTISIIESIDGQHPVLSSNIKNNKKSLCYNNSDMTEDNEKGKTYANISELVDDVLRSAIAKGASDVHFEPERNSLNIRFRIDGFLHPYETFEKTGQEEIISRIKVLASMEIMEKRFPQDGHLELYGEKGKIHNVRVSTFPTNFGEAAVLRLLNREDVMRPLEGLGFEFNQLDALRRIIASPYGMCLSTGPTASGKTTLLYSILTTLKKQDNNIITLEDPIEFQMDTVRQLQIKENIGLTFPKALRSVMRQDPDIVMLGELRDPETVQMSVHAALSGILVFSTFHTFDISGIVIRFFEMGVPRSVVAHILIGAVSTRLVRKICESCKAPHTLNDFEKSLVGGSVATSLYEGKGCNACGGSGYHGRQGVFEVAAFDSDVRSFIMEGKNPKEIANLLRTKGIKSLWEAALNKINRGTTTLAEVIRVIGVQGIEAMKGKDVR